MVISKEKHIKCVNFDLETNALLKYFKDTREPYSLIKQFF